MLEQPLLKLSQEAKQPNEQTYSSQTGTQEDFQKCLHKLNTCKTKRYFSTFGGGSHSPVSHQTQQLGEMLQSSLGHNPDLHQKKKPKKIPFQMCLEQHVLIVTHHLVFTPARGTQSVGLGSLLASYIAFEAYTADRTIFL